MTEQINLNIVDGLEFYAHELSLHFTPTQFIFDFRCVTPRSDPRSKDKPTFLLRHNVVMVDPWHAKAIVDVLKQVVDKYEDEFGKIKKPAAIEKAEKKRDKAISLQADKVQADKKAAAPEYFG